MISFEIPEEDRMLVRTVQRFVAEELLPLEPRLIERAIRGGGDDLTLEELRSLQQKAKAIGLWGLEVPEEYGGANLSPIQNVLVDEELGKTFVPFRFGGWTFNVLFDLNQEQKKEYLIPTLDGERWPCFALSEPNVGSDARGLSTRAVKDGDSWVISGEKCWVTWGMDADFALLFARTRVDGEDKGISLFLVDRSAGFVSTPTHMMGAHTTANLFFDNVRIPLRNLVGDVGKGFALAMKFLYRNRGLGLGARNVGAAERLLGMAISYAETRETFGKKIAERENIQWMIAESEVEIRCAKMLVWNTAWRAGNDLDYRHAACATKLYTAQMANRVVDRVMQIHGAMGYARETGIERWYRDLRVQRIYEGSDEMQYASIFRNLRQGTTEVGALS